MYFYRMESNAVENKNVAKDPGLITYAHTAGSAVIRPEDMGKVKGKAQMAMRQQTQDALEKIYRQIELLKKQAQEIVERIDISERIYQAQMSFEPVINSSYFCMKRRMVRMCCLWWDLQSGEGNFLIIVFWLPYIYWLTIPGKLNF